MDEHPPQLDNGGSTCTGIFERELHIRFLEMMYDSLPSDYESQEINHLTLAYFVISGLDILGALNRVSHHNCSHLASTYSALSMLKIIGYDLSNVDFRILIASMRNLQKPDGSFMPIHIGAEADLRFVYCAAAISSMLNNWNGMEISRAKDYILSCQSYDGGFGLVPGSESHVKQVERHTVQLLLSNLSDLLKQMPPLYLLPLSRLT